MRRHGNPVPTRIAAHTAHGFGGVQDMDAHFVFLRSLFDILVKWKTKCERQGVIEKFFAGKRVFLGVIVYIYFPEIRGHLENSLFVFSLYTTALLKNSLTYTRPQEYVRFIPGRRHGHTPLGRPKQQSRGCTPPVRNDGDGICVA
jgi:hypothetical protein